MKELEVTNILNTCKKKDLIINESIDATGSKDSNGSEEMNVKNLSKNELLLKYKNALKEYKNDHKILFDQVFYNIIKFSFSWI